MAAASTCDCEICWSAVPAHFEQLLGETYVPHSSLGQGHLLYSLFASARQLWVDGAAVLRPVNACFHRAKNVTFEATADIRGLMSGWFSISLLGGLVTQR